MSIERMKRIWLVSERASLRPLLDFLASLEAVHLTDVPAPEDEEAFSRLSVQPADIDERIAALHHILEVMNSHCPAKRSFGENFVGFPLEVTSSEMTRAMDELDVDRLDERLTGLSDEFLVLNHRIEEMRLELRHLRTWTHIDGAAPTPFSRCVGYLGAVTARMRRMMDESEDVRRLLVLNDLGRGRDNRVLVQAAALKEDESEVAELLRLFDFTPLPLPPGVSPGERLKTLDVELARAEERVATADATIRELTAKHRDQATSVLAWWETKREAVKSEERSLNSKRMAMVLGYVRARDAEEIARAVLRFSPGTAVSFEDPAPEEQVPVELRTSRLVAPAQFLVTMFGLPPYRAFDPSAFIMLNFLLFFGFCFGDVIYGAGLIVLSLFIASRVKPYRGVHNLFVLLAWGGLSTMIVGALTGSWAADLPDRMGPGNPLLWLKNKLTILDMLKEPMIALVVALGIGVLNQFYGIIMKMVLEFRRRDYASALFDAGLWLVLLPGLVLLIASAFVSPAPAWLARAGLVMIAGGAVGLVLTQGRREKSFLAKAIYGIVSIYGILGSYGSTAFIGDTLSYCRLLALGLTTSIVGMCFNMIAGLVKDVPVGGMALFVLVLMAGHVFNFFISVLGAFVHSARLIFVEFFGRFYEMGGTRFRPLGTSERVRLTDRR